MFEIQAQALQSFDEFTTDDGQTWHTVKACRTANNGKKTVIINTQGLEMILKSDQIVIIK